MITVKRLKKLLKGLPDDAKCSAYEGERTGINIHAITDDLFNNIHVWWIDAGEGIEEETYTEGFKTKEKNESIRCKR